MATKTKVTNISDGPRGAYLGGVLVFADPGETIEADDFAEEWFAVTGDVVEDLNKMKVADLKALAETEGLDLGDAATKADIITAIELGRESKADEGEEEEAKA